MTEKKTYTILLVDDDSFLLDMYSLKFTQAGHIMHAVLSAREGIKKLEDGLQPDAVVFDLVMPDVDGFAFIEEVKEKKLASEAALIILSNQGEKKDLERAKELGAIGHIVKANTIPSEVVTTIVSLIKKHKNNSSAQVHNREV